MGKFRLQQAHERNYLNRKKKKKKEDINLKDMSVLMNWVLFTVFIFGAFASDEKARMDWFNNLDQRDKDNAVEFLTQSIKHYNGFNQDVLMDMEKKFGITPAQTQQLYEFLYSKEVPNQFSKDNGVSWIKDNNRWHVQLVHNEKLYYHTVFENERFAAMSVHLICEKYEKERTLATINIEVGKIPKETEKTSQYKGFYWNKKYQKWSVMLRLNEEKQMYGGMFDNELDAAKRVKQLCEELEIPPQNLTISAMPNQHHQKKEKISKYIEVCWNAKRGNWYAQLMAKDEIQKYGGHSKGWLIGKPNRDELEAAKQKLNQLCEGLGITRQPSYIGVTWKQKNKKWHAQLAHKKKKYNGGHFDDKVTAAMSVNLLCDKYKIERKNPTINIELEEYEIRAINNAINKIILFDLQQVTQIFKKQTTDEQKISMPLWPLFDSPNVKTVILGFLITDYNSNIHIIENEPQIIEEESQIVEEESQIAEEETHIIEDESNVEKRKRKKSDDKTHNLQDKKQ